MLTVLLFALFLVLITASVVLAITSIHESRTAGPRPPMPAARRHDPFAPILRAGPEADGATTVRMLLPK